MTIIDPQFENMRVLQPFRNFEARYQGQAGTLPIAFPGVLDPLAGQSGYASTLGAGERMPAKGARIKIWFPQVGEDAGETFVTSYGYAFELRWRLRNYQDYRNAAAAGSAARATPYSMTQNPAGYPTGSGSRVFIPGGADVCLYEQTEPGSDGDPGDANIRVQRYVPMITSAALPLAPVTGSLVWQQGAYEQTGTFAEANGVSYSVLDVETQGDELSIWVYKIDSGNTWDFGGDDEGFSYTFGTNNGDRTEVNPNSGILISVGVAGS